MMRSSPKVREPGTSCTTFVDQTVLWSLPQWTLHSRAFRDKPIPITAVALPRTKDANEIAFGEWKADWLVFIKDGGCQI